jgi:hypothetical protein
MPSISTTRATPRSAPGPRSRPPEVRGAARRSLAALLGSVCLHAILVLGASVGWARSVPLAMPGPFVVRASWVEADLIAGDELSQTADEDEAQASDRMDPGLEDRAQGPPAGDPATNSRTPLGPAPSAASAVAASPAPKPTVRPAPPAGRRAPLGKPAAPAAPMGPSAEDEPPGAPRGIGAAAVRDPGASSTTAAQGRTDVTPGEGGGFERSRDPDVGDRFTHDLPSFAQALVAWREAPLGETGEVELVLVLDAEGKIASPGHEAVERNTGKRAALVESIRRTIDGLYASFSLPGGVAGPGKLRLRVNARVSDLPAPAQPRERVEVGSTRFEQGRARAFFTLEGGRHVEFEVELVRTERQPAAAAIQ